MPKTTLATLRRRAEKARGPTVTCPASRWMHMIADRMARGQFPDVTEAKPQEWAADLYAVLADLWELRSKHPRAKISRKK